MQAAQQSSVGDVGGSRLVVMGQGYVGLPLAIRAVEVGYDVVGVDVNDERIASLARGSSYVEDIPDKSLQAALGSGRFRPVTDMRKVGGFDYAIVTVPTPLLRGSPDLSFIKSAADQLAPHLRPGATVVLESTTYPGTTRELFAPRLEQGSGLRAGHDFHVGYSPERIDPGNPKFTVVNTPKLVSGLDVESSKAVQSLYNDLVERTVLVSRCEVAELSKLLENTFRHVNIALVNEIAIFAHALGIDVWEAISASSTKPFGFLPFTPGPGVGGHCLPIDPTYLSWHVKQTVGTAFRFVDLANDINDHMPDYVVHRAMEALNEAGLALSRSRVLLVGVAYKRNSSDTREAPALRIAETLLHAGADVSFADPYVRTMIDLPEVQRLEITAETVSEFDLVMLLTDHDVFDYYAMRSARRVLDCRGRLRPAGNVIRL